MRDKDDIFEEFEFKPLTEGLGFHKKAVNLKSEVNASGLMTSQTKSSIIPFTPDDLFEDPAEIGQSLAELTPRQENREPEERSWDRAAAAYRESTHERSEQQPSIYQPLPREKAQEKKPADISEKFTPALKLDFTETVAKSAEVSKDILREAALQRRYDEISSNMTSAVFDAVVAFTFSILFLVAMISVTEIDIVALVFNAKTQLVVQGGLVVMYLAILQLYMIVSRVIGGCTLGEWAFDVHVAEKGDRRSAFFAFKVIFRSLVSMLTGFILLPMLSLIFRKDLAGRLSGTRLYQQQ